jgi:hypothetical protein
LQNVKYPLVVGRNDVATMKQLLRAFNKRRFGLLKAQGCHANLWFARNESLLVRDSKLDIKFIVVRIRAAKDG